MKNARLSQPRNTQNWLEKIKYTKNRIAKWNSLNWSEKKIHMSASNEIILKNTFAYSFSQTIFACVDFLYLSSIFFNLSQDYSKAFLFQVYSFVCSRRSRYCIMHIVQCTGTQYEQSGFIGTKQSDLKCYVGILMGFIQMQCLFYK